MRMAYSHCIGLLRADYLANQQAQTKTLYRKWYGELVVKDSNIIV
jgi:hypothetical protein